MSPVPLPAPEEPGTPTTRPYPALPPSRRTEYVYQQAPSGGFVIWALEFVPGTVNPLWVLRGYATTPAMVQKYYPSAQSF